MIKIQNLKPTGVNEKSIVYFPKDIRIWSKDSNHVILNKTNGNWVSVKNYGRFIVDYYQRSGAVTVASVIPRFAKEFGYSLSRSRSFVFYFLNELLNRKFISRHKDDKCLSLDLAKNYKLRLRELYFQVTDACNLSCRYCYNKEARQKSIKEGKPKLTTNEVVKFFKDAKNLGAEEVTFGGGEPLLEPELINWVCHAHQLGLRTELFTRGPLITEDSAKKLNPCVSKFIISLDSANPEECDFLAQRKNIFNDTIRALEYLVKAGATSKILIRPTVTQKSKKGALNLVNFMFKKFGITHLSFMLVEDSPDKSLNLSFKEKQDLYVQYIKKVGKIRGVKKPSREDGMKEFVKEEVYSSNGFRCGAGSTTVMVDPYGYVYPCQGAYYPEFRSPQSVKTRSLEKIYRTSPTLRKFRSVSKLDVEKCRNCDYKTWCPAYCPAHSYTMSGDFKTCPSKLKFPGEKDCVAVMEKSFWLNTDFFLGTDESKPRREISCKL